MDYFRKEFLSRSALSGHKHRQIYRSYLNGACHGSDERRGIANNAESHFGLLDFR